uniref:Uncharacterized protein n=1 Tax=Rhizophora mucronata TaxID=61149 RepID=A0A2P2N096_RHIMU
MRASLFFITLTCRSIAMVLKKRNSQEDIMDDMFLTWKFHLINFVLAGQTNLIAFLLSLYPFSLNLGAMRHKMHNMR